MEAASIGRALMWIGGGIALLGLAISFWPKGFPMLGQLPGDIRIQKENMSFYFPFVSCLVVSVIVSLLIKLFRNR